MYRLPRWLTLSNCRQIADPQGRSRQNNWALHLPRALPFGVAMLLFLPVSLSARPPLLAATPVSRLDTSWWKQRFDNKNTELRTRDVDLLWLGDSITENWERGSARSWENFAPVWKRFYGDRHAVNLGFKGDSTCHLLWRLEHGELDGINPKAIVLLIGANNFGHIHAGEAETYTGIVVILSEIHRRLPTAQVLLLGVLPSLRSQWVTHNTKLLDQRLGRLPTQREPWLHYKDASPIFEQQGRVNPDRFLDPRLQPPAPPLHPTAQSQEAMASLIEPTVAAMMHDRLH